MACGTLSALLASVAHAQTVRLYYESRVPFMVRQNDELHGSEGAPATEAFRKAGIAFTLTEAPVARQVAAIASNLEPACAIGLYKTAEREKIGKYTSPIFLSQTQDIVLRSDSEKMRNMDSLAKLLGDSSMRVVLRNGYSYGANMDALLENASASIMRPPQNSEGRMRLVLEGMADAAMFTADEAEYLIQTLGIEGKPLVIRHFNDSPPGQARYLLCSKLVDDELIRKLNDAIARRAIK